MKNQERPGAGSLRAPAPPLPPMGDRLPSTPRERKPALAALAVLLILAGALGATMLVLQAGDRVEVVKVTKPIAAGESVTSDNVTSVMVAEDESIDYVLWSQLDQLKKLQALNTIPGGVVAVGQLFGEKGGVAPGKATVGLSLKAGQFPDGLKPGDTVAAYRVGTTGSSGSQDEEDAPAGSAGTPLVAAAVVDTVEADDKGQISSGNKAITVVVNQDEAAGLASAASALEVAVVRVPKS